MDCYPAGGGLFYFLFFRPSPPFLSRLCVCMSVNTANDTSQRDCPRQRRHVNNARARAPRNKTRRVADGERRRRRRRQSRFDREPSRSYQRICPVSSSLSSERVRSVARRSLCTSFARHQRGRALPDLAVRQSRAMPRPHLPSPTRTAVTQTVRRQQRLAVVRPRPR